MVYDCNMDMGIRSTDTGSEWRKVDVHVHTPASHDYHAKGTTFQELADAINNSDTDIIAITDHWTLDGYRELKPLIATTKVLLPGVEVKLDKNTKGKTGEKGGFHAQVIFPENTDVDDIRDKFLNQLALCEVPGKIPSKRDLTELGRSVINKEGASDDECWEKGCQQAYVDFRRVGELAHQLGGLVVIPYDRHGGFEGIDPIAESALKSNILKGTDIVETLQEDVRTAFLEHPGVLKAAGKRTPAFKSSDSHEIDELGREYTWVKGEKSFEGMRQALYFPSERISFDADKPKYHYPRIQSIKMTDSDGTHPLTSIDGLTIPLNENLTTIIGHPSIGKSTLVESVAYLFDTATDEEVGEDVSKIENLQAINPDLKIEAVISTGGSTNKLSRCFDGEYDGDITVQEVPVTYVNQGYIDRTARNPEKVAELLTERMDTSAMEQAAIDVRVVSKKLRNYRENFLGSAKLLATQKKNADRLAGANKFFEISKSSEYAELERKRKTLAEKYQRMSDAATAVTELKSEYENFIEANEANNIDVDDIKVLFPDLDTKALSTIKDFPSQAVRDLDVVHASIVNSKELKEVIAQGKKLSSDIKDLFAKEKITYTQTMWDEKVKELQLLETTKRKTEAQLATAESNESEFMETMGDLDDAIATIDQQREDAMVVFNEGLKNVEVKFEATDPIEWLSTVLTDEVKAAWDQYTPIDDKALYKFQKPSLEDIGALIDAMVDDGCDKNKIRERLIECLDSGELPVQKDWKFQEWLFGGKSKVIADFLRLRLREYVPEGQIGLYYDGKNIAKQGLSYTERCGALLEIILEKGVEPLIIDQPEDNLGSTYITSTLIPTILRKKHSRQIILISHNPNTVVLADSDLVIAFDRDGNKDGIDLHAGAIESVEMKGIVCDIIEGGMDAFKVRSERYHVN